MIRLPEYKIVTRILVLLTQVYNMAAVYGHVDPFDENIENVLIVLAATKRS